MSTVNLLKLWGKDNLDIYNYDEIKLINSVFLSFDKYVFSNQLSEKLKDSNLTLKIIVDNLTFSDSPKKNIKIIKTENAIFYYIDKSFYEEYISISINELFTMVKYFIIDLVIILFENLIINPDVYIHKNKLTLCLLKDIFDIKSQDPNFDLHYEDRAPKIDIKKLYSYYFNTKKITLLLNDKNSCYLDSLLFVILIGDDPYIKNIFFNTNVYEINMNLETFKNPYITKYIKSKDELSRYSRLLQKQLLNNFLKLMSGKPNYVCHPIRNLLFLVEPKMKSKSGYYKSYSPSEIYSNLSISFPKLIHNVPVKIFDQVQYKNYNIFMMFDFIDPEPSSENMILWDNIDADFLVFQLGVYPRVKNYGYSYKKDKMKFLKHEEENLYIYKKYITKKRYFDEYILNKKYRLFGAVRNHGPVPTNPQFSGGGHYTAYIRPFFDTNTWYYYNDIGPTFEKLDSIPYDIFIDGKNERSELLFYTKV